MRRIWQLMWLPAIILLLMSTGVVGCGPSPVTMATAVPPDAAGVLDTPQAYLERGDLRADRKDYQMAIADYTQAIELRPTFAEAFDNRGYAHYWSYQAALAIDDYSRAIELRPNYPFAYNNRGAARMAGGDPVAAIADFDRAIELQPDLPQAHTNRANALLHAGRVADAFSDAKRAGGNPERAIAALAVILVVGLTGVLAIVWLANRRHAVRHHRATRL